MLRKASANKNSKIPNNIFHKLQCSTFRIKFQRLELLPFNFEIPVIFTQLSVVFSLPFWRVKVKYAVETWDEKKSFSVLLLSGKKTTTHSTDRDKSSEWPAQNSQILQIFFRKCRFFKIIWQSPKDQRPNSKTFKWQLMEWTFRNFTILRDI